MGGGKSFSHAERGWGHNDLVGSFNAGDASFSHTDGGRKSFHPSKGLCKHNVTPSCRCVCTGGGGRKVF